MELVEKKCLEISLPQISHQYEKNQNFDRDGIFEKDDARLRLRTKIENSNNKFKSSEFTYKKRLDIENGIKKKLNLITISVLSKHLKIFYLFSKLSD